MVMQRFMKHLFVSMSVKQNLFVSVFTLDKLYGATTVGYHEPRRWGTMSHDGGVS